jgi:hypothetical protein
MTGKPWRPSIHDEAKAGMNRRDEALRARLGLAKGRSLRVDRTGRPMSEGDWAEASDDREYVRVAEDAVGDVRVSTVWIGTDDRVIGGGPDPQIFETMVRDHPGDRKRDRGQKDRGRLDGRSESGVGDLRRRYATEEEALIGHRQIVAVVKAKLAEEGGC